MSSHFKRIHVTSIDLQYSIADYITPTNSRLKREREIREGPQWRGERVNYMRLDDDEDKYLCVIASKIVEFSISWLYRELNFSMC